MKVICNRKTELPEKFPVQAIAERFQLENQIVELLLCRGVDSEEKIARFLNGNGGKFSDPFLLPNMRQASERIRAAVEDGQSIVIFGDYDADGVCASAMLYLYLKSLGAEVNVFIPEREQGYGLNEKSVETIMEEYAPDLLVTVDCGVANAKEIEYIYELGGEVLVTDHHRIQEVLPNCVVVNPWLAPESEPFTAYCGAGVVFKLIQALDSEHYADYADFAALATIADSVPLLEENRDIVSVGLPKINAGERECFRVYRKLTERGELCAEDVAFYLAPCVNAAGRFQAAAKAFQFLTAADADEAETLCREMLELNEKRKAVCDEYTQICENQIVQRKLFLEPVIIVSDPRLDAGIIGIVASRLTEKYVRPAIVFQERDGVLKGSARSVEGVNLFDLLSSAKDLLTAFGGHAQAAGLSLEKENLAKFRKRAKEYVTRLDTSVFEQTQDYDFDLDEHSATESFVRQMERLNPFGSGFPYPVLRYTSKNDPFSSLAKNPKYISIQTKFPQVKLMCFQGDQYIDILSDSSEKQYFFQLKTTEVRGRTYLNATVRQIAGSVALTGEEAEMGRARYLEQLYLPVKEEKAEYFITDKAEFTNKLDEALSAAYGTLVVCNTLEGYEYFTKHIFSELKNGGNLRQCDFVKLSGKHSANAVVVAAGVNLDWQLYSDIFFVDTPLNVGYLNRIIEKYAVNVTCLTGADSFGFLREISLERAVFGEYYKKLRAVLRQGNAVGLDYYRWFRIVKAVYADVNLPQFIACSYAFAELGILKLDKLTGTLRLDETKSVNLSQSEFYKKLERRIQDLK